MVGQGNPGDNNVFFLVQHLGVLIKLNELNLLPVNLKVVNEDDGWSVKMSTNQLAITLVLEQETTLDTIIICVFHIFLHFLFSILFLYQLFKLFIGIFIPVL